MNVPVILARGTILDEQYEILRILGEGGAAVVYEARRIDDEAIVAVKVLAPDVDPHLSRRRFFNELLLATRVRHDNFVKIHDFGVLAAPDSLYIVMERLHGRTLWQELRECGPLPPADAIPLFLGALGALAAAHAMGVVHKDIKPSNLFLAETGPLEEIMVVLDFGIASRPGRADALGVEFAGSPPYVAPEYLIRGEISPRVDVYQLGLVLAEALSGQPVVASNDVEECFRIHRSGALTLPCGSLPGPLREIVERAVAFDPERRWPDAAAMREALRAVSIEDLTFGPARPLPFELHAATERDATVVDERWSAMQAAPTRSPRREPGGADSGSRAVPRAHPEPTGTIERGAMRGWMVRHWLALVSTALGFLLGVVATAFAGP